MNAAHALSFYPLQVTDVELQSLENEHWTLALETALTRRMHDQAIRDAYHARLPIKRYGKPEEIAAAAAFLASEEAAYITGHLLDVDGGFDVSGL